MLSIIVPVYNVKDYVVRCLTSVAQQQFSDYEVIVVDDGSTDGSAALVDDFCAQNPRFRVIHKENGGLMSAWMKGVTYAIGDYFGFVDSDDYVSDTMYVRMYEVAKQYDADIVMCDRYDVDLVSGQTIVKKAVIEPGYYAGESMEKIYSCVLPKFSGVHITNSRTNKIFKRELFLFNTRYCEGLSRICEDRFITPGCMFGAKSFYYLDEPHYYYINNRPGANHSMPYEKLHDALESLHEMQVQMIKDNGKAERYLESVERANLNYLRLMIMRNFAGKGAFSLRRRLAKRVLKSELYAAAVRNYSQDLTGKLGVAVKWLFRIKSPTLFVLVCSLAGSY